MKKYITKKNIIIVVVILVVLMLLSAIRKNNSPMTDGQIITNLASLTSIPDINTDVPQIYAIDTSKPLQPFFKGAQKGDVAVLFLRSQKAYIYSPSRNMVVNSGPIDSGEAKPKQVDQKTSTSTQSATTTKTN